MNRQLQSGIVAAGPQLTHAAPQSSSAVQTQGGLVLGAALMFGVTIFSASGLLFFVEPMFARMVLPRLGGSPSVWNTCVLFFQATLLLGYIYAHLSTTWLGTRRQAILHGALLLIPLLFLPLNPDFGIPDADSNPVLWLLTTMTVTVGVPFFVLSTTAPLLQRWFATLPVRSAADPYFLYSASNLGSMLALLGYPFVIEPAVGLSSQTRLWTVAYGLFVVLAAGCIWFARRFGGGHELASPLTIDSATTTGRQRFKWLLLSFAPSSLMLGVTLHISTDIAAVPLLWVVPLATYLLTFILAFSPSATRVLKTSSSLVHPLAFLCLLSIVIPTNQLWFVPLHLLTFFVCALTCHRKLADSRPDVRHLTEFYIWVSLGGVLGGIFNSLLSPDIFATVFEYPLVMALTLFLVRPSTASTRNSPRLSPMAVGISLAVLVLSVGALAFVNLPAQLGMFVLTLACGTAVTMILTMGVFAFRIAAIVLVLILASGRTTMGTVLFTGRSFFGVVRVVEARDHSYRILMHGSTDHGRQQLPATGCEPVSYYDRRGPIGQLFRTANARLEQIAVVGLGGGGLACYGQPWQHWTMYEIDPLVDRVASNPAWFTHLQNSAAATRVVIGDGRMALQREPEGQYDLIVLDAFSSDAVPVHLLTNEAIAMYVSRLRPNGILAVHISNRYLRLEPIVSAIATKQRLFAVANIETQVPAEDLAKGRKNTYWVTLARDRAALADIERLPGWRIAPTNEGAPLWTDDYSNIFKVMKLR